MFLSPFADKLVILDEVQRLPSLFPVLRVLVDEKRRPARFLLLGSASPQLIRQSAESLAGRVIYHELSPITLAEVGEEQLNRLWLRGGFPTSLLAENDAQSLIWRESFIQTHLERDIPALGIRVPASQLRRFWSMLAHHHGQLWNASTIATSMGVSAPTINHYLEILEDTFMLRRLSPWSGNLKKRLIKSPKVYLRDSGLLHALLGISDWIYLTGHPVLGASWEGWVIEQILSVVPAGWQSSFYRTSGGAEIDLVLESGSKPPLLIEIKYSSAPKPSRSFWSSMQDFPGSRGIVVAPITSAYPLTERVDVIPVSEVSRLMGSALS